MIVLEFQSTHPVRGATVNVVFWFWLHPISIHAPRAGCDLHSDPLKPTRKISIHAPRAGCDHPSLRQLLLRKFQSTHPVRGATHPLSILSARHRHFNPRTPCGVRPDISTLNGRTMLFQSTHPVRGATITMYCTGRVRPISIHAPRAGCDSSKMFLHSLLCDFNPRTPCGVRLQAWTTFCRCWNFNPRTPCGVRHFATHNSGQDTVFQSTHPVRGATMLLPQPQPQPQFQSTHPVRGATANLTVLPGQICAKGTKKSLFSRKNAQKRK